MIILTCSYCGEKNLIAMDEAYEAKCPSCKRVLHLWEMQPIFSIPDNGFPATLTSSETTCSNLTQSRV